MKKTLLLLLCIVLTMTMMSAAFAETPQTFAFTDSVGRTVQIPVDIQRVMPSGPLAQIVLFALCPDQFVGLATEWDQSAKAFLGQYYHLPLVGQLYGTKGELNLETVAALDPQVIIDIGEPKDTIIEDLDALQEQLNIPFVHITATTDTMADAYRKLGELLNKQEEAETLAAYCDETYARMQAIANAVDKINLLYLLGDSGLNVIARGSYHAEIIDMMANNVAVVDNPTSKGSGNEVDMEQLLLWNPDFIIFAKDSIYSAVASDPTWQELSAVQNGRYVEAPFGPYNWMGFPPSVQRQLGMLWMGKALYPDACDYDLYEEAARYFKLFYHCDLTKAQYDELTASSFVK